MREMLELLQDGSFHSGEDLGRILGISRTAVWKRLQSIAEKGFALEVVRGKGYRLDKEFQVYSERKVLAAIQEHNRHRVGLVVYGCVGSTNDEVLKQDIAKESYQACVAESQTAGRGRRGRSWISPLGNNIYLSMLTVFTNGLIALDGLSLVVGLALFDAIKSYGIDDLSLKWPNDLMYKGKKLAGILLEIVGEPNGNCRVVIGVGVNLKLDRCDRSTIYQSVVDLNEIFGKVVDKNVCVGIIINQIVANLDIFKSEGFLRFRDRWLMCDALLNKKISVLHGDNESVGISRGIDDRGRLLFEKGNDGAIKPISAGEVRVRNLENS